MVNKVMVGASGRTRESGRVGGSLGESGRIWESLRERLHYARYARATTWARAGEELGKSWERAGEELGKSWARAGKRAGKSWGKSWEKSWERAGEELGESWGRAWKTVKTLDTSTKNQKSARSRPSF